MKKKSPPVKSQKKKMGLFSMIAAAWDYASGTTARPYSAPYAGRPMYDASKKAGGLIGYTAPSYIDIDKLRANSRRAMIDSPEMISLMRTMRTLVIGDGLKVSSAPERAYLPELKDLDENTIKQYRKTIDTLWEICAESTSFDVLGERSLACLMMDAFEKWMQDGEVIISFQIETDPFKLKNSLTPLRVSLILPEDLKTPGGLGHKNVKAGIELDSSGAPIAYYIKGQRVTKYGEHTGRVQISVLKNGQTLRGIPPFAVGIQEAKMLQDYALAEVEKNTLGAEIFMGATGNQAELMKAAAQRNIHFEDDYDPTAGMEDGITKLGRSVTMMKVSDVNNLIPIDTPKPSQGFTDFINAAQRRIFMMMGMSRDIVTKDISTSYSAARFQGQLTQLEVSTYVLRFTDAFVRPLWENWFMLAVEDGHFPFVQSFHNALQRKSWMAMEVIGRPLPDLSPLQEASANEKYLKMGVLTRTEIAKKQGFGKFEDTFNTLVNEERSMSGIMQTPNNQETTNE